MTTPEYYAQLLEQGVLIDKDENVIGRVGQVYQYIETDAASWVTVKTGWFGTRESFIPLNDSTIKGTEIRVPYDKDTIKGAPHHEPGEQLTGQDEDDLYTYYGIGATGGDARSYPQCRHRAAPAAEVPGHRAADHHRAGHPRRDPGSPRPRRSRREPRRHARSVTTPPVSY